MKRESEYTSLLNLRESEYTSENTEDRQRTSNPQTVSDPKEEKHSKGTN